MKFVQGMLAGVVVAVAAGAAAQCLPGDGLTPLVRIFDARTHQELLACKVTITMLDGHRIMCDRGPR